MFLYDGDNVTHPDPVLVCDFEIFSAADQRIFSKSLFGGDVLSSWGLSVSESTKEILTLKAPAIILYV